MLSSWLGYQEENARGVMKNAVGTAADLHRDEQGMSGPQASCSWQLKDQRRSF